MSAISKSTGPFRAFNNRNYALFFTGQSISQLGTWMQRTAVLWVIYTMGHSAALLGWASFAQLIPSFLLSPVGGIIADRYSRYKILLLTQAASMVQAILLTLLAFRGHYQVWQLLALSAVLGTINAFDVPARQPMVHEMINDKDDLTNALAFNSAMVNMARLLGPMLAGILLQQFGAGTCFLLNAASFIAVITSLLLLKLPRYQRPPEQKKALQDLKEGFAYVRKTPSISYILLFLTLMSLLVLPYNTLIPLFAGDVFKGNAATYGYLSGALGLGAIGSTILLALQKNSARLKMILLANTIICGIALLLLSQSTRLLPGLLAAVFCGYGTMTLTTGCITLIQVAADQRMRGRAMSFVAMGYFGMLPIGSLMIGHISQRIGAPMAMLCQGITAVIIAAAFYKFLVHGGKNTSMETQI